jgi:hypothetical protein
MTQMGDRNTATVLIICIIINYICFGFHSQIFMKNTAIVKNNASRELRVSTSHPHPPIKRKWTWYAVCLSVRMYVCIMYVYMYVCMEGWMDGCAPRYFQNDRVEFV